MRKIYTFLFVFTFIFLSACSNSTSSEKESKANKEQVNQTKQQQEKEEAFTFQLDHLKVKLDESLKESLSIQNTSLSYQDESLPDQNISLGRISKMSLSDWENNQYQGDYVLVYYDNDEVYIYDTTFNWPYSEDEYTSQYENYLYTFQSVVKSLVSAGFVDCDLQIKQTKPEQLDMNQQAGVDISREMYEDLKKLYTTLKTSIKDDMSLDEKYEVISTVQNVFKEKYPELRQIPFPTMELGENMINAINLILEWPTSPYNAEKANHANIDVQIEMLNNYLDVIDKQIKEFE